MIQQTNLIPSGFQYWNKYTIGTSDKSFAFCSTLSVYIYDLESKQIKKIFANQDSTITSFSWNPHNDNNFAISCMNGSIEVWNVKEERAEFQIQTQGSSPKMTHWCPTDQDFIAYSDQSHSVKVLDLHQKKIIKLMQLTSSNSPLPCKWSPKENKVLAFGCSDSAVYVFDVPSKKYKKFFKDNRQGVEDIAWNPRQNYLLAAFKNGTMYLLDNKAAPLSEFERQGQGVNCVAWIDNMSGDLVTSSPKIGALKVWNASHNRPRSTVKLGITGVKSLLPFEKYPERFLVAFKSGAVGIYNFELKKLEFCTEAGHTETVFDLDFKPDNCNLLATVSYDGNIKIWDIESQRLTKTLSYVKENPELQSSQTKAGAQKSPKLVCYGVAWGPQRDDTRIAATNNLGEMVIWDTEKERILCKFQHTHQAVAVRVKWNQLNPRYIAYTVDKYCYVLQVAENYFEMTYNPLIEVRAKIDAKQVLFGLSWNPFQKLEAAVSGNNGLLNIYNLEESLEKPTVQLKGHMGKVADIAWNPHYRSILASCSDDKSIRVWDTNANEQVSLTGHTQHTRGISWNYEMPWLLISGSWDSTIRIWDLRTRQTIHVIRDHIADVYGIVSHPKRPFLYSSCSRDTTIRLWRIEGFVHSLLLKLIFRKELDYITKESPPPVTNLLYEEVKNDQLSLCGGESKSILKLLTDPSLFQKAAKAKELLSYLGVYDGQTELFSIVESIREKMPSAQNSRIVHLSELLSVSKSRVEELESTSNMAYLGTNLAKKEERLLECARILLEMGDYRKYCQIMLEIGHFDKAMAFAPAVSLQYWREVAIRIAQLKGSEQMEQPAEYFQIANEIDRAVMQLQNSQKYQNAKLIKTLESSNLLKNAAIQMIRGVQEEKKEHQLANLSKVDFEKDESLRELVNTQARALFNRGQQVLAAAAHLAINDTSACLEKLIRANELYLALVIASLMSHPGRKEIVLRLAQRAEGLKMHKFAAQLYHEQKQHKKIALMVKRLRDSQEASATFIASDYKIEPAQFYQKQAQSQDPQFKSHIFNLIMAGDLNSAASKLITLAKQVLGSADSKHIEIVLEAFELLQEVRISGISEKNLKAEVLMYSAAIGAIKAIYLGFYRIIPFLIGAIFSISDHQHITPVLDLQMFQILEEAIAEIPKEKRATCRIQPQFQTQKQKQQFEVLYKAVQNYYSKKSVLLKERFGYFCSLGSNLPVNSKFKQTKSILTNQIIRGKHFELQDGVSFLSIEEALQWAEVNRFSPLNNGCLINPF